MTVLIVEDEIRAAKRLEKLVLELRPEAIIPEPLDSVEESIKWLKQNPAPAAILLDIELADGKSFEILEKLNIQSPIIFCTAFDQYALEAFKYHGAAYLLKPIKKIELKQALDKALQEKSLIDYDKLAEALQHRQKDYQQRILVKLGQRYKAIPVKEIAYAFTEQKNVMVRTFAGKDIPVDQSLEQLDGIVDPKAFFRINRQLLVSLKSIQSMYAWSRSRLKLELEPPFDKEAIVATDRAGNFKEWLEGRG